ncbi:MAG TPA: hypothetical protein VMS22_21660 [Candidatus Eisenbacteria bacterium]|nr:hypothetical protein [Candidatus Eisenbacteria bacterium]
MRMRALVRVQALSGLAFFLGCTSSPARASRRAYSSMRGPGYGSAALAAIVVGAGVIGIITGAPNAVRTRFSEFRELYQRFLPLLPPRF